MAFVVFLRAVNVGGRRVSVTALAGELGLVNVGAAGTFVAKKSKSEAALAMAIAAKLPFVSEVMVRPAAELLALVQSAPFAGKKLPEGAKGYVTVLAAAPKKVPPLPLERPEGEAWETRLVRIEGRYALSVRIPRGGPRIVYPNEVVEKALGVAATTRGWDTILAVAEILKRVD